MQTKYMKKNVIIGFVVGFISGFFATGGGLLLFPILTHYYKLRDIEARATTIFSILPITVISSIMYIKNSYIDWKLGLLCATGGVLGSFIGTKLTQKLKTKYLKLGFICFIVYASYTMIFK